MKPLKLLLLAMCFIPWMHGYGQQENTNGQITITESAPTCNGGCCCDGNTQAPLGVMTDHIHNKGQWMVTYTYMNTMLQGNNIGASKASDNAVYNENYMMAPETMEMQMHMVMAMYGVTDRLTLMAMGGYAMSNMSMNMSDAMMNM